MLCDAAFLKLLLNMRLDIEQYPRANGKTKEAPPSTHHAKRISQTKATLCEKTGGTFNNFSFAPRDALRLAP